jgi:alpha-galactosidase
MDTSLPAQPGRFRLRGLDSATTYRLETVELSAEALVRSRNGYPSWLDGIEVSGELLQAVGLQAPMLYPEQALLFRLVAVTENTDPR